jgi:hypothetical protein
MPTDHNLVDVDTLTARRHDNLVTTRAVAPALQAHTRHMHFTLLPVTELGLAVGAPRL